MKTLLKFSIKALTVVLSILAARALHAEEQAVVWSRQPDAVRKFFPADKYKMLDAQQEAKDFEADGYMLPHKRNALFAKLGIEEQVAALDDMDKDILVMTARSEDAEYVHKHYPMLDAQQAKALVKELTAK